MQCPPSPLLFDPSLTLEDHSVKDTAEGPVDTLASEEQPGQASLMQPCSQAEGSLLAL